MYLKFFLVYNKILFILIWTKYNQRVHKYLFRYLNLHHKGENACYNLEEKFQGYIQFCIYFVDGCNKSKNPTLKLAKRRKRNCNNKREYWVSKMLLSFYCLKNKMFDEVFLRFGPHLFTFMLYFCKIKICTLLWLLVKPLE